MNELEARMAAYQSYINRFMKEGEWYWSRFKVYLSLNSGAIVVLGALIKPYVASVLDAPPDLWVLSSVVAFVGIRLSNTWKAANADGERWQNVIREQLCKTEAVLAEKHGLPDLELFLLIDRCHREDKSLDVMSINIGLAKFFVIVWWLTLIVSFVLFLVSVLVRV